MNPRNTLRWIIVAVVLFGFILVHQKFLRRPGDGPGRVLPMLRAAAVTSLQVRPAAGLEIRAERTNGTWQLTAPLAYPAQAVSINKLLTELERLTPAPYITARELQGRLQTDQEYGFATPQASLTLEQPGYTYRLRVGANTAPGDQVFLQVVGVQGVYVVNADFLRYLPRTADDWRDTTLVDLHGLAVDWLAVTNGPTSFELRRDDSGKLWRMTYPLQARANSAKVEESLQMLQNVRVLQFVPDDPKLDLEMFGLQTPELVLALGRGSNVVVMLQFGKSPTNDARLVYARRLGLNAIVAVGKDLLAPWYASVNDFRDPLLVRLSDPVTAVEVLGPESFSLQQQTNGLWQVLPQDLPADSGLVRQLLSTLGSLPIVEFAKDVVIPSDLPTFGLAPPVREYVLKSPVADPAEGATNTVIATLAFGTNQADRVFARRADESFVYAVRLADFQRLPSAGWQMRDRQIWNFSTNDVAGAIIQEQGHVRRIVRNGPYRWSLAPGSQGIINDLAVEETVGGLCHLAAVGWLARGEANRGRFGLTEQSRQITLELKGGHKACVQFCGEAAVGSPCAAVTLEGELWFFKFPPWLHEYVQRYLSVPPNP